MTEQKLAAISAHLIITLMNTAINKYTSKILNSESHIIFQVGYNYLESLK